MLFYEFCIGGANIGEGFSVRMMSEGYDGTVSILTGFSDSDLEEGKDFFSLWISDL